jgi:lipoate-protein ligase A
LLKAEESYRRIHDWLRLAFAELRVKTELASCCKKSLPGQCFAGHEKFDLLWHGKKIAGAAQRRNKSGLLIQGSVQPPLMNIARAGWENAMLDAAREPFQVEWREFLPDEPLRRCAAESARHKYAQDAYNQKR